MPTFINILVIAALLVAGPIIVLEIAGRSARRRNSQSQDANRRTVRNGTNSLGPDGPLPPNYRGPFPR